MWVGQFFVLSFFYSIVIIITGNFLQERERTYIYFVSTCFVFRLLEHSSLNASRGYEFNTKAADP